MGLEVGGLVCDSLEVLELEGKLVEGAVDEHLGQVDHLVCVQTHRHLHVAFRVLIQNHPQAFPCTLFAALLLFLQNLVHIRWACADLECDNLVCEFLELEVPFVESLVNGEPVSVEDECLQVPQSFGHQFVGHAGCLVHCLVPQVH